MSEQKRDNGGPAFPAVTTQYNTDSCMREVTSIGGMSLRDYFAAKVLQGFHASQAFGGDSAVIAALAYERADAMLKEREK